VVIPQENALAAS